MKKFYISFVLAIVTFLLVSVTFVAIGGITWNKASAASSNAIVGTWFVKADDAPFHYHMFVFNADGTMQQANPDAGDTNTSDSDGKGVWEKNGDHFIGKFDEVTANRSDGSFNSRGEISFDIQVGNDGNSFTGTATARFYDLNNNQIRGPFPTPLEGSRIKL